MDRRQTSVGWALAASLVLHALLVVLALRTGDETRPRALRRESEPIAIEIVQARPLRAAPVPRPVPAAAAPAPAAAPGPVAAPAPLALPEAAPAPVAEGGGADASRAGDPVDLFSKGAVLSALGEGGGGQGASGVGQGRFRGDGFGDGESGEVARVGSRIRGWVADGRAVDRVQNGLIDPWFSGARRRIDKTWAPRFEDIGGGEKAPLGIAEDFARSYQAQAERFGKSGSPYPEGATAGDPHGRLAQGPLAPDREPSVELFGLSLRGDARQGLMDMMTGRMGGAQVLALVLVEHGPPGSAPQAEIVQSSGFADFDLSAIVDVERALAEMGERPRAGLALESDALRTLWAMKADFWVVPPWSMASGTFDEVEGTLRVHKPLDRVVNKQVVLLAVYTE